MQAALTAGRHRGGVMSIGTRSTVWLCLLAWLILMLCVQRFSEADVWYHLRNAQDLLSARAVPRFDHYTFTSAGAPLVDYEWLSELPYYSAFRAWGMRGLLAVYAAVLLLVFAGVYHLARRRGANYRQAALATFVGVALGSYSFGPRMMHFGWLCLVGLLLVLDRCEENPKLLWLMPPLFAAWINLHGSWVLGFVVLGAVLLDGSLRGTWGAITAAESTGATRPKPVAVAALGSIAALFVNPYGVGLVRYPFDLLFRQQSNLSTVIEWQSVDFHSGYGKLAMLMILGVLAIVLLHRKPWRLRDVLLVGFALWASLTHARFLILAGILLPPILACRVTLLSDADRTQETPALNLLLLLVMIVALIRTVPSEKRLQATIDRDFPRAALAFLQEQRLEGRLFNAYDFGGFVEWNAPSIRTFADGRTDIFVYNGVLHDYLRIVLLKGSFEVLDKYAIRYVLYPPGHPLTYLLDRNRSWHQLYADQTARLYERTIGAPATRTEAPSRDDPRTAATSGMEHDPELQTQSERGHYDEDSVQPVADRVHSAPFGARSSDGFRRMP